MSVARALSEYQKWQSQREYEAQAEKKEKKNKGFFEELVDGVESVAKGIGYVGESLFLGAARGVEGIIDYTFGGIGDLFGADDFADDMMKTDFLNYNHANDWYNPNKVMSFVGDVGQGIGNMLPAIAVTAVSGGTAVPAAVAAGTATFGVSAAGQATSDVAKKNGSVGAKEWLYGTASGAAEAGIEAISGGIGGTQAGKVLGKQMAKTTGGKLATAFVSEGLEEVAADFVDPFLKRTTGVDKNASVDWQNLPRTFLLGGTTGAVMGGGQRAIRAARMGGYNNLNAAENAQTLDERLADNNMRQAKGKKLTYTQEDLAFVQERLSTNLQKMSADKRAAFFAENKRIAPYFNADGTVKGFASVKKNGENTSFSAAQNKNLATVGARYSVQKAVGGKDVVVVDSNILDGVPKKEWVKTVKTAIKQFNGGIPISGKLIKVNADTGSEYTNSKDSQYYKNHNAVIYKDKLNAANNLDEIVLASTNYVNEDLNHKRKDNIKEFARGEVLMEIGGRKYNANVIVGFTSGQNMVLYDVIDFVPAQFSLRQKEKTRFPENRSSQTMETMSSTDSIRQTEEKVNGFDENSSKNSSSRKYLGGDEYADNVSTNSQTIGKVNEDAYSASLKGRESTLKYQPVSTSEVPTDIAKNVMNTITKLTNGRVNIVLTSAEMLSADGQRVNGEYADGVLYLNANATDAERAMFVGAHELMHSLEGTSEYGALADFITEQIKSDPALAEKYDIEKYEEAYANAQEKEYSKETKRYEAETEVFADFIAREVLSKEDTARRLVNRNRNVVVRMLEWVRGAIERLGTGKDERAAYRVMKKTENLLAAALDAANGGISLDEVEKRISEKESSEGSSEARYSLDKSFAKRIDKWDGDTVGFSFIVGRTSAALKAIGVDDRQIRWDATKIKKTMTDHSNMSIETIKKVPQVIENPILIMDSKTIDGRLVLLGDIYDDRGDVVTIILELNPTRRNVKGDATYLDIIKIASAQGRSNTQGLINGSNIRYIDNNKKRVNEWLKVNRLQLPLLSTTLNSNVIIRENGEKVNTSDKKSSKNSSSRKSLDVNERKETSEETVITRGMTEQERYEILKDKKIALTAKADNAKLDNILSKLERDGDNVSYDKIKMGDKIRLFKKIGEEFGVFKEYNNKTITLSFKYSRGSLDESVHKQKYDFDRFAKMLTCFDTVVENAIGLEVHNRNEQGYKPDSTLKNVYVLVSAFEDGGEIVPVKMEVKEFADKQNTLYVAIALKSIKKDEIMRQEVAKGVSQQYRPSSNINIADLLKNVNPLDENFYKYIPKMFFEGKNKGERTSSEAGRLSLDVNERKPNYVYLQKYLHRLNLSEELKAQMVAEYGEYEAKYLFAVWENRTGRGGVNMDTALKELAENGVYIDAAYDADILYEMDRFLRGKTPSSGVDFTSQIRRVTESKERRTAKEKAKGVVENTKDEAVELQIQTTNAQAGVEKAGKRLGVKDIEAKTHKARCATAAALNMITEAQWDYGKTKIVGKSLNEIFAPVQKRGDEYTAEFYEYLLHYHNEDRMRLEERAQRKIRVLLEKDYALRKLVEQKDVSESERTRLLQESENGRRYLELKKVKNKPVFGEEVTAHISVSRRAELKRKHPEFFEIAKEVWTYNKNLLQYRVDAGLITQELADRVAEMYEHYVPTIRDIDNVAIGQSKKRSVAVKKTIKTATGGEQDILDLSLMMSNQTKAVMKAAAENDILNTLYEAAETKQDFSDIELLETEKLEDVDINYENEKPKENRATFYRNGEKITVKISRRVFAGLDAYHSSNSFTDSAVERALVKMNSVVKSLVTQYNPLFLTRNAVRDFQEALFYTKNGMGKFVGNLPRAIKLMKTKGKLWQVYLAMGGTANGYFSNETGIYDRRGKIRKGFGKILDKLETVNNFVEQIPRFNEFVLSVENGASYEQALLDSADVTTNFSRGGKLTKKLNRAWIPFLNPSIQGGSKLLRTFFSRKTLQQWALLVMKTLAVGISVGMLNDLINGDDEEYQALRQSDKDNYYLLPMGNGKFIKIPKGRVVAAFGSFVDRTKRLAQGEEGAFDDYLSSVSEMISPLENVGRNFLAPFSDVVTNTTWYGGEIESRALQSYAPSERYDESTSSIAIALGKFFNYSPKKIHYLIDQYSGVIGDIILPATTAKAERDMFSAAFVVDPVLSNSYSTRFYDLVDEVTYAKSAGDPTAVLTLRYLNKVSSAVSDMYGQKREIENSDLSDKEKQAQTRTIQALINKTLAAAIVNAEEFEQIVIDCGYEQAAVALVKNATYQAFDSAQQTSAARKLCDYYYEKAYAEISGERYAIKYYLYDAIGGDRAAVYLTAISAIESDKDAKGQTIANSRKKKVHAYIEKLRLTAMQKYMLMCLAGYVPTDTGKTQIERHLRAKGFSTEEIKALWT